MRRVGEPQPHAIPGRLPLRAHNREVRELGVDENTNGLLRQYYPKGTDLSALSQAQLYAVAKKLNTRPRETPNWKTPAYILSISVSMIH
jgi:IS30 family transposase